MEAKVVQYRLKMAKKRRDAKKDWNQKKKDFNPVSFDPDLEPSTPPTRSRSWAIELIARTHLNLIIRPPPVATITSPLTHTLPSPTP